MTLTARVMLGLTAGLLLGLIIAATRHPVAITLAQFIEPLGTVWLNALRMTVIPLVFALLVTAVVSATDAAAAGRLGGRMIALAVLFLGSAALLGAIFNPARASALPEVISVDNGTEFTSTSLDHRPHPRRLQPAGKADLLWHARSLQLVFGEGACRNPGVSTSRRRSACLNREGSAREAGGVFSPGRRTAASGQPS